ncbi:succinate dehydrogenase, cytochrome b556 subunit, variant [Exophiala mesophila]|uniref:Succinate dehydrogenase, cytochrome b556 subunit, variant n=1 Tax=Exophiala mesophila TaxID=212818 RepID=A0A0D1ZEL8_EXOME|nr:succinate dehydrogenase, cytochrome b556 subunit, variant [Exophiala mesophila]KIV92364.1 succinate dehydrogenase, cytochrome b556 subunit, variant [Exophiala mesophila]
MFSIGQNLALERDIVPSPRRSVRILRPWHRLETYYADQHSTYRPASSSTVSQSQGQEILAQQRLNRPVSPHLTIYRPQVTWYLSALNRITGVTVSGAVYAFGAAYLAAPLFGWHLESASLAASFAALPILVKVGFKAFFAFPFAFHSWNGLRHLLWDTGAGITNKQVIYTGWTVVGLSVASALALTFM